MRKLALPALAACVLLAASAPVVSAQPVKAHASASLGKKLSKVSGALKGLAKAVKLMNDVNKGQTGAINGVDTRVTTVVADLTALQSKVNAVVTVATDSLTKLQTGLVAVGAGLTSLKSLATSTEYGIGQVLIGATPAAGSFVVTPDIPDTVNQAQTTQQFVAGAAGNITVLYAVRSAESDGVAGGDAAAACKVTVTNEGGTTAVTAVNPALGGVQFQFVPLKSSQTSTDPANAAFPFGLKATGADADNTVTFASGVPVGLGDTYTIGLACVDTTPSSTDPTA